jgi:hypothetical protein
MSDTASEAFADPKTRRKIIAAGVSGNVLEWYDFGCPSSYKLEQSAV